MWAAAILAACAWLGLHAPGWLDAVRETTEEVWHAYHALPWHERI